MKNKKIICFIVVIIAFMVYFINISSSKMNTENIRDKFLNHEFSIINEDMTINYDRYYIEKITSGFKETHAKYKVNDIIDFSQKYDNNKYIKLGPNLYTYTEMNEANKILDELEMDIQRYSLMNLYREATGTIAYTEEQVGILKKYDEKELEQIYDKYIKYKDNCEILKEHTGYVKLMGGINDYINGYRTVNVVDPEDTTKVWRYNLDTSEAELIKNASSYKINIAPKN